MKSLNYLMDHVMYQIFRITLNTSLKKHGAVSDIPLIRIYVNKIENTITFKIKAGYCLELLTPGTMKLPGSTKSKITKDENGANMPHSEITEVVLTHFSTANNGFQQDSRVLYTFVPNKPFTKLFNISPKNFIFLKTFKSEFSYIKVGFTDQNSKPLEIEDKINITLHINQSVEYN